MTTVIGLPSGKEFVVEDGSYFFTNKKTGLETRIFVSSDGKRLITIPSAGSAVEFYDEPASDEILKDIQKTVGQDEMEVEDRYDPNVR